MVWPRSSAAHACSRLHSWLSTQDSLVSSEPWSDAHVGLKQLVANFAQQLSGCRNPLVWIESADVAATRAAVQLAAACQATVHVAYSPGAQNVSSLLSTHGLFGTSLAEAFQTADLIVHIGQQHLQDMPLLAERFLNPHEATQDSGSSGAGHSRRAERRHVFIGERPTYLQGSTSTSLWSEAVELRAPREEWAVLLTGVLLSMRTDTIPTHNSHGSDASARELATQLLASRYTVILWGEDIFADELDRLLVERLHEIAQRVNQSTRCSLLPLSVDPGRTTAKETLLWLTNRASTTTYRDGRWCAPTSATTKSLDDWQRDHDWIVCVRTLPSDRPLPDLPFNLVIDAACNQKSHKVKERLIAIEATVAQPAAESKQNLTAWPLRRTGTSGANGSYPSEAKAICVSAVGLECSGQLTRVDHGFAAYVPAAIASTSNYLSAAAVLHSLANAYRHGKGSQ